MTDRGSMAPLTCDEVRDLGAGFVLGALEPGEMDAVRAHLATCSDAHEELAGLAGVVPYLADSLEPVEPPASLRGRILDAVAAEARGAADSRIGAAARAVSAESPPDASAAEATAGPAPRPGVPISLAAERARRRSPLTWLAAAAAVLVIVGLGAWNVSLRRDLDGAQAYAASVDRVLALAGTPGGAAAILAAAQPGGPTGIAAVGSDGRVEIAVRGLAPISGTEVYQAWVIGADGKPIAIGSFTPNANGFGSLAAAGAPAEPGLTVALTREPGPGQTTPTPPVLTSGVASGST